MKNHKKTSTKLPTRDSGQAPSPSRIFLLSPAFLGGVRAQFLLNPDATFPLARQFHTEGLSIAALFAFTSGLYFRGKITYASWFGSQRGSDLVRIISSNAGLIEPNRIIGPEDLRAWGQTEIDPADPKYFKPLRRDALKAAMRMGPNGQAILLGSIATGKYRDVLLEIFGARLFFPTDFVGRGDMSRGALLLRAVRADQELSYSPIQGTLLSRAKSRESRSARVDIA